MSFSEVVLDETTNFGPLNIKMSSYFYLFYLLIVHNAITDVLAFQFKNDTDDMMTQLILLIMKKVKHYRIKSKNNACDTSFS